jgi:hypothetical protein
MMTNAEYKSNFIAAIRAGGETRERAFQFFEERLGPSFKGPEGFKFYEDLLAIVREADEGVVKEYQKRFVPLLDQNLLQSEVMTAFKEALPEYYLSKLKDRAEELKNGGQTAVNLFVKTCFAITDEADLITWIGLALPSIPEDERNIAVAFIVREAKSHAE